MEKSIEQLELEFNVKQILLDTTLNTEEKEDKIAELKKQRNTPESSFQGIDQLRG